LRRHLIIAVLVMLAALSPTIGLVCGAECEQPAAACHESGSSPTQASWKAVPHACDLDHTAGQPFLLTPSNDRSPAPLPSAALADLDASNAFAIRPAPGASGHHPPGRPDRQLMSRTTVLRI
jgi:hypothetical protein